MLSFMLVLFCVALVSGQQDAECGKQHVQDLEVDGETVKAGEQPWRITVSHKVKGQGGDADSWQSYCPGTLISPKHVVTLSTHPTPSGGETVSNPADLQLAAGQYIANKYIATVQHAQKRGVSAIIVHDPPQVNPANNIRLMVADSPFVLSWAVNVACVDWTGLLPTLSATDAMIIPARSHGVKDASRVDVYSTQHVALVSQSEAYAILTGTPVTSQPDIYSSMPVDPSMFYAKATNSETCFQPQGGGVMVQRSTASGARYYLTGVVSAYLKLNPVGNCYISGSYIATNVVPLIDWLKGHVHPNKA